MSEIEVTEDAFQKEVLESKIPVVVDFWAPWCGPCQAFGPIFKETSKDYEGKVQFAKVNIDDNPKTAEKFDVMSIPTILLFKGGKLIDQTMGALSKEDLKSFVEKAL